MRGTYSCVAMTGAFISLIAFTAQETDARGRGGGARGGGSMSMSRGGGGGGGGGFSRGGGGGGGSSFNRGGGGGRSAHGGGSFSRGGNYSRPSGGAAQRPAQRPGGGTAQRPAQRPGGGTAQRPGGGGSGTQRPAQRPAQGGNINRGNINTGNINRGNINTGDVNFDRDVHVDVDNDWNGWGGYYDHPVGAFAAGAVVGAATAAVIGSRYYALPTGCAPYPYSGLTYYSCGSAWYQPSYQGDTVVYVVVNKPG